MVLEKLTALSGKTLTLASRGACYAPLAGGVLPVFGGLGLGVSTNSEKHVGTGDGV